MAQWKLLVNSPMVAGAYVFALRPDIAFRWRHRHLLRMARRIQSGVWSVGPPSGLDRRSLQELHHLAFYGGHLSVGFATTSSELIETLLELSADVAREPELPLTDAEERTRYGEALGSVSGGRAFVMFGHDGEPIVIVGLEHIEKREPVA